MKSNDFVKYLTVQLVERIDNPKMTKSNSVRVHSYHWFGFIPLAVKMFLKRFQKNS